MTTEIKPIDCPEYASVTSAMDEARKKVAEHGKAAVAALFKRFFQEYPNITAIGWTQYTPYFNDGDACVFSLGELYASTDTCDFSHASLHDEEFGFGDNYDWGKKPGGKKIQAALRRLGESVSQDVFEAAFGDHVLVIATPAGIHVNQYSHD